LLDPLLGQQHAVCFEYIKGFIIEVEQLLERSPVVMTLGIGSGCGSHGPRGETKRRAGNFDWLAIHVDLNERRSGNCPILVSGIAERFYLSERYAQ
jgi:hypothetical protein